jgi:thiosulfate/3-mercaptopyruvate sulfurtransferase
MGLPEFLRRVRPPRQPTDPAIDPQDISSLPNLWLLDARDDSDHLAMPVPGAVQVPVAAWIKAARNPLTSLDNVEHWQKQVDDLGIGKGDAIAVFDDGRLNEAARVWFILQHFGLNAFLVNGSASDLLRARLPPAPWWPIARAVLRPGTGRVPMVDRKAVQAWLDAGKPVLDARSAAEHAGLDLRGNPRGGHIPGARSLPHAELLDGRHLRTADEIRQILDRAGFTADKPFVAHCDAGGRSALTAVAALRAGYPPPAVYFLSFSDWSADASAPVTA